MTDHDGAWPAPRVDDWAQTRDTLLFRLPYRSVRTATGPDAPLLEFLQSAYEAAADLGGRDRQALDEDPGRRARRR